MAEPQNVVLIDTCLVCRIACAGKPNRCGACRVAVYCSKEHQVADWPRHKPVCSTSPVAREELRVMQEFLRSLEPTDVITCLTAVKEYVRTAPATPLTPNAFEIRELEPKAPIRARLAGCSPNDPVYMVRFILHNQVPQVLGPTNLRLIRVWPDGRSSKLDVNHSPLSERDATMAMARFFSSVEQITEFIISAPDDGVALLVLPLQKSVRCVRMLQ
jgi:hypothetical protein